MQFLQRGKIQMNGANKFISTKVLAEELKKNPQDFFRQLSEMGLIVSNGNAWELTPIGKAKGGQYRGSDINSRFIVWPESLKFDLSEDHLDNGQELLTSTLIGKHFEMSAQKINSILSELGLIEKSIKGYEITSLGKRLGGIQCQHRTTGSFFVRWPESIKNNKIVLSGINEIKGIITPSSSESLSNIKADEIEFRDKFKPTFRATDGHMVRSKSEMLIDNELYRFELAHAYERKLPIEEDVYCDFYIPSGKVYIEYWGYDEDSKYVARKEEKLKIYKKYDFRLIQLTEREVQNLDDNLPRLLLGFGIRTE